VRPVETPSAPAAIASSTAACIAASSPSDGGASTTPSAPIAQTRSGACAT
jgi:hypothetical protein